MQQTTNSKLLSTEHLDVAVGLTDIMLEEYSSLKDYKDLVEDLRKLRDVNWKNTDDFVSKHALKDGRPNLDAFEVSEKTRQDTYNAIFAKLDTDEKREHFMEAFARMAHLYEMGGLIARDNFFFQMRKNGTPAPNGAEDYIQKEIKDKKDASQIVEALNKPTSEYTFTAHPTNTNSLESMKAQRSIALAFSAFRKSNDGASETQKMADLKSTIRGFVNTPLTPHKGNKPTNIDVAGETEQMLYFLGNIYEDMDATYKRFDEPLKNALNYNPLDLNLKFRFNSWGSSGDKDGNKKVNAQTTLYGMVAHREAILARYENDLKSINAPALAEWQSIISKKLAEANQIKAELKLLNDTQQTLSDEKFNALSKDFSNTKLDVESFEKSLTGAYNQSAGDEEKLRILKLTRKVRTFGDNFGKIEYRETAEEFTRIASLLIDGYADMTEENRVKALTGVIQSGKAPEILAQKMDAIKAGAFDENGKLKPYSNPNVKKGEVDTAQDKYPIAYHTIKRLELVRDHPETVTNQVMAECENTSNFLEVKMLMEALAVNQKKPVLNIVPLFEAPEVMKRVESIMENAYKNPVYKEHMELVKATHPAEMEIRDGKTVLTQQIQFAHSDNSRRAGMPTARANIDEGHDVTFKAGKRNGIETRFYEGGSYSDPFRGGTRAPTAETNQYGTHNFVKKTAQNGDLLNIFNYPHSAIRFLTRGIVHGAKHYAQAILGNTHESKSPTIDALARKSLQSIENDYQVMFSTDMLGKILGVSGFGHAIETPAGQAGSRAQRVDSDSQKQVSFKDASSPKNPDDIRTINFSELLQHDGITPTWLGSRNLKHQLSNFRAEALASFQAMRDNRLPLSEEEKQFEGELLKLQDTADRSKDPDAKPYYNFPPSLIRKLYTMSPCFKDIMDKMVFGIGLTNLDGFEKNHPELSKEYMQYIGKDNKPETIMKMLRSDYFAAASLTFAALTGENLKDKDLGVAASRINSDGIANDNHATWVREQIRSKLAYGDTMAQKSNTMDFVQSFKHAWMKTHETVGLAVARLCHNALDTVSHGRFVRADDPRFAEVYNKRQGMAL